jgi:two-component system sensor histidine kinase KdpD
MRAARRRLAEWALLLGIVAAVTGLVGWRDAGPASALRHLYMLPTAWAALRFGFAGGLATAVLAIVLDAPAVLRALETWGLDADAVEALVTFGVLLLVGALAGALADRARRQLERFEALLALQRQLSGEVALAEALALANRALRRLLRADAVEVVVRRDDGTPLTARGPRWLEPGSAAAWVAAHGRSRYVPDAAGSAVPARPRRVFFAPLLTGERVLGVVAVERAAAFSRDERAAVETLAVQIALALDNARLKTELEAKVAAAAQRLGELDRAKSELISVASHELRTPLTSLRGFSELLLMRRYGEADARRFVSVIHAEAERLGRILDNLLDLARIESGQGVETRPVPVPVSPLLETQVELWSAQGAKRSFRILTARDLPLARVDRDAIDRVLTNLISNAVKYSEDGTEIRLLAAAVGGNRVEIAVEDDGLGIPAAALPHIFERYYRVPRPGGTARGLGLGLALVRALVEANGGTIRVESAVGKGSRFTLSLPAVS